MDHKPQIKNKKQKTKKTHTVSSIPTNDIICIYSVCSRVVVFRLQVAQRGLVNIKKSQDDNWIIQFQNRIFIHTLG